MQQPERSEAFYIFSGLSLSGLSLARFKIAADILMAFAGEFFAEEIEDTESLSTRRDSAKPERINISILSGCCL